MYAKIFFVLFISSMHILFGLVSFVVGVFASIKSLIWMAQTVSPIWSGAFVIDIKLTHIYFIYNIIKYKSSYYVELLD